MKHEESDRDRGSGFVIFGSLIDLEK